MDLEKHKKVLIEAATKAGNFIRKEFDQFKQESIEYKSKNDLVSYVDKEAEKIIIDILERADSSIGFIAEESHAHHDGFKGYNWIIDPLDGTTNFIHGIPHFAVSLALANNLEVMIGLVYHVMADEMYVAVKGQGAFKNGEPLKVSDVADLGGSIIATGFPYKNFDYIDSYFKVFEELLKNTHGLRRFGSAALDLAYVAEGRYEAFFEYNLKAWDLAAGVLLVTESGGQVSDFVGDDQYLINGNIVSGGAAFDAVLDVIKRDW